jgi:hypothetical protein
MCGISLIPFQTLAASGCWKSKAGHADKPHNPTYIGLRLKLGEDADQSHPTTPAPH